MSEESNEAKELNVVDGEFEDDELDSTIIPDVLDENEKEQESLEDLSEEGGL